MNSGDRINLKIDNMAKFNKFSVLVIILISGFKLGLAADDSQKREFFFLLLKYSAKHNFYIFWN